MSTRVGVFDPWPCRSKTIGSVPEAKAKRRVTRAARRAERRRLEQHVQHRNGRYTQGYGSRIGTVPKHLSILVKEMWCLGLYFLTHNQEKMQ